MFTVQTFTLTPKHNNISSRSERKHCELYVRTMWPLQQSELEQYVSVKSLPFIHIMLHNTGQ